LLDLHPLPSSSCTQSASGGIVGCIFFRSSSV
jgi:hypothetical protein